MRAPTLARILRMPRAELSWRVRAGARIEQQRLAWALRRPRWRRRDIGRVLAPDSIDDGMRGAIAGGQWAAVHARLRERLLARPSRHVLDPRSAGAMRQAITARWPEAPGDAARRADRLLAGTYDLLGYRGVSCTDWHVDPVSGRRMPRVFWASVPFLDPRFGDHKVIWELNRHQHWLTLARAAWLTGNPRYAAAIVAQLGDWLAANPPLTGANWASMLELGFRSLSWVWAMQALLAEDDARGGPDGAPWLVDMLIGLERQLSQVAANLSYYFSPNTHLTGEALALYVVGHALPELARSQEWVATGRRVLLREIERQVAADGGHVERSTHYQRYTLDFYLLALATARINGDTRAALVFRDACTRLADFSSELAGPDGRLPLIGDDDGGMLWPIAGREPRDVRDSLAVAAGLLDVPALSPRDLPEEAIWVLGPAAVPRRPAPEAASPWLHSRVFEQTGYIVIRGGGDHLVFDAGAHGYLNAGHAHADALAVTLDLGGAPLLIDPGTGTYTMDPVLRDRLRGSASHNTLTLDERSSSEPDGPFHWRTRTDARIEAWRGNGGFCWAEAAHDGYRPVQHRRSIFREVGGGWLILDEILGEGRHRRDVHWHFAPDWTVSYETGHRLRMTAGDGRAAWLVHEAGETGLACGDGETGLGWCSPTYGARIAAPTARITHTGSAPFARATWIGAGTGPAVLERVPIECDAISGALGFRVRQGERVSTTVLRPGEAPERDTRSCSSHDYHTDARLVHYAMSGGALTALSVADVSHLLSLHEGLVSIAADAPLTDLHLSIDRDQLDVLASTPPPRLRLEGGGLSAIRTIRLNGREQRRAGEAIELAGSDWAPCAESPVLSI